ncbi:MAG: DUF4129 domain-containing protein [Anaerolineales bacterium]|nr:DUF4129 domain-containing protein [Anaerolineales bacterium]MCB0005048.1 DUF4129 domain-containing protein [Anaerolineales bacterium]MCB0010778.1 DUF4129 domain-containing protein [Anaerolineales bacterium]MCB0018733.1 DUF4129 domain-containing protein [Anaerolineales bacterium]MCB0027138.1 DUF4129 domain-containing protein [Anaerolineales bacterium]
MTDMQLQPARKRQLLLLGLVLVVLVVLAASLPNLIVDQGRLVATENPFLEGEATGGGGALAQVPGNLIRIVIALLVAFWLYLTIRYQKLRNVLKVFAVVALFTLLLYFVISRSNPELQPEEGGEFDMGTALTEPTEVLEAPDFVTAPADWVTYGLSLAIGVVLVVAGVLVYRQLQADEAVEIPVLEMLAKDAELTLNELRAGANVKDAISRCYQNMTQSVQHNRGMVRSQGMTPREFAQSLDSMGLPRQSVERLTTLFEQVRYGAHEATQREKMEAVACMEEIIDAIRPVERASDAIMSPQ